jgi:hypothetical protein
VENEGMELNGFVQNGVIVLSGGATLPEGTPVTVSWGVNMAGEAYDDSPWMDEERDALRCEALDELGWEGMEAYQDDAQ